MSAKIKLANGSWKDLVAPGAAPQTVGRISASASISIDLKAGLKELTGVRISGGVSLQSAFSDWIALEKAPEFIDTAATGSLSNTFLGCTSLKTFSSALVFPGATSVSNMFQRCIALESIPLTTGENISAATSTFYQCTSLEVAPRIGFSSACLSLALTWGECTAMTLIQPAGTTVGDTSKVTSIQNAWLNCTNLLEIPAFDFSAVTTTSTAFSGCTSLASILAFGWKTTFSVAGTALNASALNVLFGNLATATTSRTITITGTPGAATCDRAIATAKGWTVTG
jgi:hypothetical protein